MKCRVFKRADGGVIYSWPSAKHQDDFSLAKFPPVTNGLPFVDLEEGDLPSEEGRDWFSHGPLIMDGECSKDNLKFDDGWNVHTMPVEIIKRKHEGRVSADLDEELAKDSPDPVKVISLQRQKEKVKSWTDEQAYEQALKNIQDNNIDKPLIVEKLKAKLGKGQGG